MGALDTAKEIARVGTTFGLSKDVVDLLKEKTTLLAEQVASLERENALLKTENEKLRAQVPSPDFIQNDGLLWKRTPSGFERRPYCPICSSHPPMMEFPPHSQENWVCPANHTFAFDSHPPSA